MNNDKIDIGDFIKENLWKMMVGLLAFAGIWATMQGYVSMNRARILAAEIKIDDIEEALVQLVVLEEREAEDRKDIQEIKEVVKEINQKMDKHILDNGF